MQFSINKTIVDKQEYYVVGIGIGSYISALINDFGYLKEKYGGGLIELAVHCDMSQMKVGSYPSLAAAAEAVLQGILNGNLPKCHYPATLVVNGRGVSGSVGGQEEFCIFGREGVGMSSIEKDGLIDRTEYQELLAKCEAATEISGKKESGKKLIDLVFSKAK